MPHLLSQPILIASDHAGIALKGALQKILAQIDWQDLGPASSARVDYPDYAERVATRIARGEASLGVLICGSGIGMSIAANKVQGVRAALVDNPIAARLSRQHNDANVLCLGARFIAPEYAAEIAETFLSTPFSSESRHLARILKISALEGKAPGPASSAREATGTGVQESSQPAGTK
jgi:ribose 5-phosphate isomerase B